MSSNRPLFDDEDLPDWLQSGINATSQSYTSDDYSAAPVSTDDDMDWLDDSPAAGSSTMDTAWMQDLAPSAPSANTSSGWAKSSTLPTSTPAFSFDDEPKTTADESFSREQSTAATPSAISTPVESQDADDLPPWAQTPASSTSPVQSSSVSDTDLDWMSDPAALSSPATSPAAFGLTGALPWRQDVSESADDPAKASSQTADFDFFADDSQAQSTSEPLQADINDLDWLSQPAPTASNAAESTPVESTADDDLDWLNTSYAEPVADPKPAEPIQPTAVPSDDSDWLNTPVEPPTAAEPSAPPADAPRSPIKKLTALPSLQPKIDPFTAPAPATLPTDAPRPAIKRLPTTPPADAPRPQIRKLPSTANQPNSSGDDWDMPPVPDDQLLDVVPDWFNTIGGSGSTQGADQANQEADAPDWFKSVDLSGTPLVGPDTISTLNEPTTSSSSPEDEIPDWFAQSTPGVDDLDFTMFVAEEPVKPKSKLTDKLSTGSLGTQAPIVSEPVPETPVISEPQELAAPELPAVEMAQDSAEQVSGVQDDADLDWMAEMPDVDDMLFASTKTYESSQVALASEHDSEPTSDAELLDWMSSESNTLSSDLLQGDTQPVPAPDGGWMADPMGDMEELKLDSVSTDKENWVEDVEPEPDSPAVASDDMPDWMRDMASSVSTAQDHPTELTEESAPESDMPDWMRDMAPAAPTPIAEPALDPEMDWLADFSTENAPSEADQDWMSGVQPTDTAPDANQSTPTKAAPNIDIDALLSLSSSSVPAESQPEAYAPEPEFNLDFGGTEGVPTAESDYQGNYQAGDQDSFDFDMPEEASASSSEREFDFDAIMANSPDLTNQFDQLAQFDQSDELLFEGEAPSPAESQQSPAVASQTKSDEVLPEWVADMRPAEGPVILHIGDQEVRFQDRPLSALPEQVRQLREQSKALVSKAPPEAEAISSGPLAGIAGAIDIVSEGSMPRIVIGERSSIATSDLETQRIKIIEDILGLEKELLDERVLAEDEREAQQASAAVSPAAAIKSRVKIDRFVITLLLVAAVLIPFFTNVLNVTPLPDSSQLSPAQQNVMSAVDSLKDGQSVLVAFEYGPTAAGELDDLARAILRDIVKHNAQPIIVSTNPAGALHAQALMQSLGSNPADLALMNRTDKPLVARQDYVVLRYLPGGTIGVRSFTNSVLASNFQDLAVQATFRDDIEGKPSSVTDVNVINLRQNPAFILAETPDDVRAWVEQYQSVPPQEPLKMVLLSSASASAVSQAYATSANTRIIGPLVGLRDTMIYQAQRQPLTGKVQILSDQRWQSIGLATLIAVLIILLGLIINVFRGLQGRSRR
ncbi:MAG: hypothetical protein ABI947_17860 [Chloroflexota bacterium]